MDPDDQLSDEDNDLRWFVDETEGIVQLGSGPWGGSLAPAEIDHLVSSIDGSSYVDVRISSDDQGGLESVGSVVLPADGTDFRHYWSLKLSAAGLSAEARGITDVIHTTYSTEE